MAKKIDKSKRVETLTHDATRRRNIPTAEYQSVMHKEEQSPVQVAYERRNRDLDPQLVWRGKDEKDWSDLAVDAPPLYIQEKVHPKALIDDLWRQSKADSPATGTQTDLFSDFNGLPSDEADRVLPARCQLEQPHDPWRQPASHGVARRARRTARQGAVYLP